VSASKLTKAEIIESIFQETKVGKKVIHEVIDKLFEEVKQALVEDRVVELRGFGTFEVRMRKGRENARNPKTGELTPCHNHGVTSFRPGRYLKLKTWNLRG